MRFASLPPVADSPLYDASPREKRVEIYTCDKCEKVRTVIKNCPHFDLVAIGDEKDEESALYDAALHDLGLDPACLMTRCAIGLCERMLFAPTEVIFDCAAYIVIVL